MNPFLYPGRQHSRSQKPGELRDYRRFKPVLRIEFSRQCVYCRMPDGPRGKDAFGVDHYRPISLFPELQCAYSNLYYACNACNRRKRDFWPEADQLDRGTLIPNPCDHLMSDHLRFQGPRVAALSPTGQFACDLLDLNDEGEIQYREFLLRSMSRCLAEMERCLQALQQIDDLVRKSPDERLLDLRTLVARDLLAHQEDLERLIGSGP